MKNDYTKKNKIQTIPTNLENNKTITNIIIIVNNGIHFIKTMTCTNSIGSNIKKNLIAKPSNNEIP